MSIENWSNWLWDLATAVVTKLGIELIAVPIVMGVMFAGTQVVRKWRRVGEFERSHKRLNEALVAVSDKRGLWVSIPSKHPADYSRLLAESIPIITIANLKGGVGKTTIAANLAAHFGMPRGGSEDGKRVLLIDLDFQGSLSSMLMLPDDQRRPTLEAGSRASELVSSRLDAGTLTSIAWPLADPLWPAAAPRPRAISAYYDLAQTENRTMVRWLLKQETNDIRYFLAETLLDSQVQRQFDLVIIDAPPRLTTGAIQAFCASTHVLIPTILDDLSAEAVTTFVEQVETLKREQVCPYLRYAGIVGSMVGAGGDPEGSARKMMDAIRDLQAPVELLPSSAWIKDRAHLGRAAGNRIAYIRADTAENTRATRENFDELGAAVRTVIRRQRGR